MPKTQPMGPVRRRGFPGRPGLLVVALLWAVALWFYAREEMSAERDMKAFATLKAPAGRMLRLVDPPGEPGANVITVTVTVRGPRRKVYSITPEDVHCSVLEAWSPDAGGEEIPTGPIQLDVNPGNFHVPQYPALRVVGVRPSTVKLVLEEAGRNLVPVRVIPQGKPRKGYILPSRPRTIPGTVEVRASPGVLERVAYVETEPVDIEGKDESFSVFADLVQTIEVEGSAHRLLTAPRQVVVVVDVSTAPVTVQREHVPVRALLAHDAPFRVLAERTTVTLSIRGPEELIASLKAEDIKVFADATGLEEIPDKAEAELPLRVQLPAGLELVPGSLPEVMKVRLEKCQE